MNDYIGFKACLFGVLAVGIGGCSADGGGDAQLDESVSTSQEAIHTITPYGPEWQNTPYCNWGDVEYVSLNTDSRKQLPAQRHFDLGTGQVSYHYMVNATFVKRTSRLCNLDLQWKYWPKGVDPYTSPTATVFRSYVSDKTLQVEPIYSGRVGNCVPGDGGTVAISITPTPNMVFRTPSGSLPVGSYYDCN